MQDAAAPTLAILIPTYNGNHFLRRAMIAHGEIIRNTGNPSIRLVVSDNCSGPETGAVVRDLMQVYPFISYVRHDEHFDTAEEHLFKACSAVSDDYVWVFGDDDLPREHALEQIAGLIASDEYDSIFLNMRSFETGDGKVHGGRNSDGGVIRIEEDFVGSIEDIIAGIGFQTVAACFSIAVVRREKLVAAPWQDYLRASPIYSHVATYLDAFHGGKSRFVARPAVDYRSGATTEDNWTRFAGRRQQAFHHPWTFGMLALFRMMHDRGCIEPDFLFRVREHAAEHVFFLWVHMLDKVAEIVDRITNGQVMLDMPTDADLDAFAREFAGSPDPLPLELAHQVVGAAKRLALILKGGELFDHGALRGANGGLVSDAVRSSVLQQLMALRRHLPLPHGDTVSWSRHVYPPYDWGQELALGDPANEPYLAGGFSYHEDWGRWTVGYAARLRFLHRTTTGDVIFIARLAMVWPNDQSCTVRVAANGGAPQSYVVTAEEPLCHVIPAADLRADGRLDILIRIDRPKRAEEAPTVEQRQLGLGISAIEICFANRDD